MKDMAATSKGTYQNVVSSNLRQPEDKQLIQEMKKEIRRRHPSKEEMKEKDDRTLIVRKPQTTNIKDSADINESLTDTTPTW